MTDVPTSQAGAVLRIEMLAADAADRHPGCMAVSDGVLRLFYDVLAEDVTS